MTAFLHQSKVASRGAVAKAQVLDLDIDIDKTKTMSEERNEAKDKREDMKERLPKDKENCKECGNKLELFADMAFTSNPPKFKTRCNSCNTSGYIYCHEIVTISKHPLTEDKK